MLMWGLRAAGTTLRREVVVSGLLAFTCFFIGSGDVPIMGRDEARFAQAAREMLERGDLVVPSFAGEHRYDKPILIYWCTMAGYRLLGVNERAARLPAHLAGALAVALLAWSARKRWGPGAGILAGTLLTATVTFHVQARGCTADLVMLLPALAAMLAFEQLGVGRGGCTAAAVLWLGLGVSVLAKGPVGPAFVVLTWIGLWALERTWPTWQLVGLGLLGLLGLWRLGPLVLVVPAAAALLQALCNPSGRRMLNSLRWWWGLPVAGLLVAPWAVAAHLATSGAFLSEAIGHHVVKRSLVALESHGGFPGFYLVTGLLAAFPWFALIPETLRKLGPQMAEDRRLRFLAAWLLTPLLLLELMGTKLVHYWMLSYPAGVLLVVAGMVGASDTEERNVHRASRVAVLVPGLLLAMLPLLLVLYLRLPQLWWRALLCGLPLVLGALLFMARAGIQPLRSLVRLTAATLLTLVLILALFLPAFSAHLLAPRAAAQARGRAAGEPIVIYKLRDDELLFSLPSSTRVCRSSSCLAERLARGGAWLGASRRNDLQRFREEHPDAELQEVDEVAGIDLGHLQWSSIVLFRPGAAGGDR